MNDESGELLGLVSTDNKDIIVHEEPRLSANKLAEYILATPARQNKILKDSKFARKILTVPYKRTRKFIPRAFTKKNLNIDMLVRRAEEIEKEHERAKDKLNDWRRHDNINSALALKKLAEVAPELSWEDAQIVPILLPGLNISGVKISICPEVIFSFDHRGIKKLGAIILNTAKGNDKSLARSNGENCVGDYVSCLLFKALSAVATKIGVPLHSKCYAVDVFRNAVYTAPASYSRLNKNIEAACSVIALRWPTIERPATAQSQAGQSILS